MLRSAMLALVLLAFAAGAQPPSIPPGSWPRSVRRMGQAHVSVRPDVAIVTLGVQVVGDDIKKAASDAAAQTRGVLAALRKAGIAEKDIQTARHDVEPQRPWENGQQARITGYAVVDELRVTLHEVSKVDSVLGQVVTAGSNVLRGVSFQKEDATKEKAHALSLAVANARTKAEAMAKAAGVQLGEVVSVNEGPGLPSYAPMMARSSEAYATPPVSVGEVDIAVSAEVVFTIR